MSLDDARDRVRERRAHPPVLKIAEPGDGPRFEFVDAADFLAGDYPVAWLVEWFLVRGQPALIAGPSKSLKTGLVLDLAVSLATATPFLGHWPVRERVRVAVVSGESGKATIKETVLRILDAKGLGRDAVRGWLKLEFTLPTFSDLGSMAAFADALSAVEADVVVIDPTYLALGDIDPKSMFDMGRALRVIADVLERKRPGITVALVHHANRQLQTGDPMELTHIAYSGLEQYVRQWMLINRRVRYQGDGRHELWLTYGGSAGAGGLSVVGIEEGVLGPDRPPRTWNVTVSSASEAGDADAADRDRAKREKKLAEREADRAAVLDAIGQLVRERRAATANAIGGVAVLSHTRVKEALDWLEAGEIIVRTTRKVSSGKGRTQDAVGYEMWPAE